MASSSSSPLLMLSLNQQTTFVTPDKNIIFTNPATIIPKTTPVGSSHGWLILLSHQTSQVSLLNPSDRSRIPLPDTSSFPLLSIRKAVLSANPSTNKDFVVFVLHGENPRIACCRNGDKQWRKIRGGPYYDVSCSTGSVFALGAKASVQRWDSSSLRKRGILRPSYPTGLLQAREEFPTDLYATKWYLVPCKSGEMFFVVRYIGEFVTRDGRAVYEEAMHEGDETIGTVCPYKTMGFRVFRRELRTETWEEVRSLDGRVLFLGGNHSVSLLGSEHPNCRPGCIYFTDDYWDRIDREDCPYGGHDMGVFSLRDGSFQQFLDFELQKFSPPPIWILPS
ncbi:hypothetical protein DM860_005820 [Cuscuta australis]|uniref:KIB1-4 beta-propeller domain-containing protein n=1 Tax=Cuscuta australis TaxID=267555 RepID=A0A328DSQ6_9ASTE|nr:hypothetical protein DM860_005820 [Cuscuta australis]